MEGGREGGSEGCGEEEVTKIGMVKHRRGSLREEGRGGVPILRVHMWVRCTAAHAQAQVSGARGVGKESGREVLGFYDYDQHHTLQCANPHEPPASQ
jgi:hypothetical protein